MYLNVYKHDPIQVLIFGLKMKTDVYCFKCLSTSINIYFCEHISTLINVTGS